MSLRAFNFPKFRLPSSLKRPDLVEVKDLPALDRHRKTIGGETFGKVHPDLAGRKNVTVPQDGYKGGLLKLPPIIPGSGFNVNFEKTDKPTQSKPLPVDKPGTQLAKPLGGGMQERPTEAVPSTLKRRDTPMPGVHSSILDHFPSPPGTPGPYITFDPPSLPPSPGPAPKRPLPAPPTTDFNQLSLNPPPLANKQSITGPLSRIDE